ncbi:MAG: hypothetical protein IKO34_14680 [Bacteroidales bacterium]|nr:hypothetical protein [Bacteroidales bacterium]
MKERLLIAIILLVSFLVSAGCSSVLMGLLGMSTPHAISETKLEHKKKKYKLNEFTHCNVTEDGFWNSILSIGDINSVQVFKDGKLIVPKTDNKSCSAVVEKFIDFIQDSTIYEIVDSVKLTDYFNPKYIADYENVKFFDSTRYAILVYWASYAGFLNRQNTKKTYASSICGLLDSGFKAEVRYVNCDVKDGWSFKKLTKKMLAEKMPDMQK